VIVGWFCLRVRVPPSLAEVALALLWERTLIGIEEEGPGWLAAYSETPWDTDGFREELLLRLAMAHGSSTGEPVVEVTQVQIEEEDWLRRWKESWRPTPLGEGLLVVPSWWSEPTDSSRTRVWIDPGQAFGTGAHVTTALAWELLEATMKKRRSGPLLDLGTGSGILGLGAIALHPSLEVVGTEADPRAIGSLRENLDRNRAWSRFRPVRTDGLPFGDGVFASGVANLTHLELKGVERDLVRVLGPEATVILSGLLLDQARETEERWERWGYHVQGREAKDGWVGMRLDQSSN